MIIERWSKQLKFFKHGADLLRRCLDVVVATLKLLDHVDGVLALFQCAVGVAVGQVGSKLRVVAC